MKLTEIALKRSRLTVVFLIVILFGGISAYLGLPRSEDPEFIIRTALVATYFPGASPERVEQLVTDKLEQKIQELPELDHVSSESRTGVSLIFVEVQERYSDMRPIWRKLRDKVEDARPSLPEGISGPFVEDDFGDVFGIMIAITGDGFSQPELDGYGREVRKDLLLLENVARVEIVGNQEERIYIEFSNARLAELGLSPTELAEILESENIVLPGGYVNIGPDKVVVEPTGNYLDIEDLRNTVLRLSPLGRDRLIYLKDIAAVTRGSVEPPGTIVRFNGSPAVLLAVNMASGGNIIKLGELIDGFLQDRVEELPVGIDFHYAAFQPRYVREAINDFMVNLLQGVGAVLLVMLVFLGIRTGLVVAPLIPMTMLMTFMLMKYFGVSLQQVSIASLIIALGMLVDNAIVMSEDIMVRIQRGEERFAAAVASGRELAVPLLTSTLTTSAAFLAIFLAQSVVGEYCASLFIVVTMALISSWLLALTMIPLFCFWFIKVKRNQTPPDYRGRFYRGYRGFLHWLLVHRAWSLAVLVVVFLAVTRLMAFIPQIFFPPATRPQFMIDFRLPEGTHLMETYREMLPVEEFIAAREEVDNFSVYVGESSPRFYLSLDQEQSKENYAFFLVNCRELEGMDRLMEEVYRFITERSPNVNPVVKKLETGAPVGAPIQIRVAGRDISPRGVETIYRLSEEVKELLRETAGTLSVRDSWGSPIKKLYVRVDQARARRAGLSSRDIAVSLQTQLAGMEVTEFREADEIIPVEMRSTLANRTDLGKIEGMNVYSLLTGKAVPLLQIARPEFRSEVATIARRDRKRVMTVRCDLVPSRTASEVLAEIRPTLEELSRAWPAGYEVEFGGEFEEAEKANQSIMAQLPISAFIILMLLVWQFNSFRKTLIILITVPMGLIGAILGLFVTGSSFGFMPMLGMVALAGIVINNAIVLIDRIQLELEEGKTGQEAIVLAAQKRFRPILLTTVTTLCGLLPLALQGGPLWEGMAWTIIGGLLFATVLTLGYVPVLYSLFYRVKFAKPMKSQSLSGSKVPPGPESPPDADAETKRAGEE
ncbi:MAG: efflux RND transporter permease subunit [Candidatus Erginobacter occultus]|nr:efflux RND transporter permease subunit [Candidatus Erginobacter occultus]